MSNDGQLLQNLSRLEELVQQFESAADPQWHAAAVEMVRLLMDLYGTGMERILDIVSNSGAAGSDIMNRFSRDQLVSQLLMLYDLHPVDLQTRVNEALDKVQPLLQSHGGDVELLSVEHSHVRLRFRRTHDGHSCSVQTVRTLIEDAVCECASDINGLEIVGLEEAGPPSRLVPLEMVPLR